MDIECVNCVPPAEGGFWWNLFSTDFVPRALCVGERPEIIWLHVVSDALIALAYYSIPLALIYFVKRRKDLSFPWMFHLFGAFILACGTTHILGVVAYWHPMYRIDGVMKAITAGLSIVTAALLWPLVHKALLLPSPSQLRIANEALSAEVRVRREAESRAAAAVEQLERRVEERTAALARVNHDLEISQSRVERKLAEIESLYTTAPEGLCFLDPQMRLLRVNETFAAMFHRVPGDMLGHSLAEGAPELSGETGAELVRIVQEVLETGRVIKARSLSAMGSGETSPRRWRVSASPVRSSVGGILGVGMMLQDTTERDELEEQLRQSQKSEAIGQLASGIAHEINNALTAIYGYLSLGRAAVTSSHPAAPYLDQILAAAQQASGVTKSLLTFARRERTVKEVVHLAELVDRASQLITGLMPAGIKVEVGTLSAKNALVMGDANQLQQVILNLAINARDAMPRGGTLRIDLAEVSIEAGDAARLTVSDTGEGMTADVMERMFEPFFTTKARGQGTGLGMAVVQGIVRSHDGTIRVRSTPGAGTTFEIDLPLAPASALEASDSPQIAVDVGPPAGAVLIAEDNRAVRKLLANGLRKIGYNMIEAEDGAELMDHLSALTTVGAAPAVLILDIDMPRMSGLECLQTLRQRGDMTPIVLISGGPINGVDFPKVFVLPKPFQVRDLAAIVARAARA